MDSLWDFGKSGRTGGDLSTDEDTSKSTAVEMLAKNVRGKSQVVGTHCRALLHEC